MDMLGAAPPEGVSYAELLRATRLSTSGLTKRLTQLRVAGQAEQVRHGRWRATAGAAEVGS